ncbi:MAG: beta-lactamase family protein [Bacteroidales bacterium]|nr:beta-lactamase family protein [Bacteroidales bacterium]
MNLVFVLNIWLMMWSRFLLLIILFFLIVLSCNNTPGSDDLDEKEYTIELSVFCDSTTAHIKSEWIDSIFTRMSKGYWFNGAVAYLEQGCLIYQKSFGLSNFRTKDTLSITSPFQLASVSKMFTAMSAMILKEDGLLDLNADIKAYLPNFPYDSVTTKMLLTHRSGLSRYMSLAHDKWTNKTIPLTNDDMLALFEENIPDPYFLPDKGFHYCNTNYALIASVVEAISGMPYAEFVQQRIFDPVGMGNSSVYHMDHDTAVSFYVETEVMGHRYKSWRPIRVRNEYLNGVTGDKGIYTSIEDLAKFDQAITANRLVSETTMREAFTRGSPTYWRRKDNYGFGWRIRESEDSTAFHFGWWKGYRAYYIRDMKNSKTLIVLTNKDKGPGSSIYWNIVHDTTHMVHFLEKPYRP